MTIHSGLLPDSTKDSISFRRLDRRFSFVSDEVAAMSSRTLMISAGSSMVRISS